MGKKIIFSIVFLCFFGLGHQIYAQSGCEPVPQPKQMGETITFYVYAYQTNRFNEVLRVSSIFKISFAFNPKVRANKGLIAMRLGEEFEQYVRGIRMDETESPHGLAASTQNRGVFVCANRDAVAEHRLSRIEAHEKWDKQVIEEEEFEFEFRFNPYQIEAGNTTTITVNKV